MLPEQQQRIMGYFIEEAKDHLNTIEQGLLSLQSTIEDSEKANEVFRAAHSVKGGAAMLGLESIQTIAHRMEDYFKILKESSIQVDSTLETMFLRVSDGLKDLLEQLEGPFGLTPEKAQEIMAEVDPVFGQLEQHLETLVAKGDGVNNGAGARSSHGRFAPGSANADALQVTFKQDVSALLRQLLSTFKQADTAESRKNLQDICTQLSSVGQSFELSAWCDLIETARLATEEKSNEYRVLAPILIKEIKKSQDLVLTGRASEVGVSEAMQALLPEDILATTDTLGDSVDSLDRLDDAPFEEASFEEASFELDAGLFSTAPTDEEDLFSDGLFDTEIDTETEDIDELFGLNNDTPELSDLLDVEPNNESLAANASNEWESTQSNLAAKDTSPSLTSSPTPSPATSEESSQKQPEEESAAKSASRLSIDLDFNEIPSELSALNRNAEVNERADESLDALLATVNVTGPDVGTEELNSLADLFDGDLEELDNTLGGHPFVSEEMRLHPEKIDLAEEDDLTDLLTNDNLTRSDSSEESSTTEDEMEDDLFGGTLTEGGFADIADLNLDEEINLEEESVEVVDEENLLNTDLAALAEDPWEEKTEADEFGGLFETDTQNLDDSVELPVQKTSDPNTESIATEAELPLDNLEDSLFGEGAFGEGAFGEDSLEEITLKESIFEESELGQANLETEEDPETEEEVGGDTKNNDTDISTQSSVVDVEVAQPLGNLSSGLFAVEPVSPSEQEIEFPTLTGVKLEEAEKDIDSFFLDLPGDDESDELFNDSDIDLEPQSDSTLSAEEGSLIISGEDQVSGDPWGELETEEKLSQANSPEAEQNSSFELEEIGLDRIDLNEPESTEPESKKKEGIDEEGFRVDAIDFDLPTISGTSDDDNNEAEAALSDDLFHIESPISLEVDVLEEGQASADTEENSSADSLWDDLSLSSEPAASEPTDGDNLKTPSIEDANVIELETADIATVFSAEYAVESDFSLDNEIEESFSNEALLNELPPEISTTDQPVEDTFEIADSEPSSEEAFSEIAGLFSDSTDTAQQETIYPNEEGTLPESPLDDLLGDGAENDWLSAEPITNETSSEEKLAATIEDEFLTLGESPSGLADDTISTLGSAENESDASSDDFFLDLEEAGTDESIDESEKAAPSNDEGANDEETDDNAFDFDDLDSLLGDDLDSLLGDEDAQISVETSSSSQGTPASIVTEKTESDLEDDEEDFDDLERLLENSDSEGASSPAASRRAAPRRSNPVREQNMRVPVKHLDNLSNLVGELVVNRNTLERDQERLRQFLDNLLFQVQQLNDVGQRMRDLYERSLLESSLVSNRKAYAAGNDKKTAEPENHATGATFDALEMDRFTGFHTLSQEMIELIVRVRESSSDIGYTVESSDQVTRQFRQVTTQLQEGLNTARMVAFSQAADRLPRAVRDISLKCGKEARLIVEGKNTLIDKMIVEHLYDPLTHLVNNAITHGIETPEERIASGKLPEGSITVQAFYQGNQTVIYVADDGGGINPAFVQRKAVEKKLITQAEADNLSDIETYELLFHAGFSTRDQADDFAGRGVGMDVVRTSLAEIRGVITIDSEQGKGTSFTIRLPLTLSISKALSCVSNQARIAFPMDGVEDMLDVPRDRILKNEHGQNCVKWRDRILPFQAVTDLLKFNRTLGRGRVYGGSQDDDVLSIIVLRSANTFVAIQVDQVIGEEEIVIKQLEGPVPKPLGIAGATILGDGRVMPIADVLELIDIAMGRVRREPSSLLWAEAVEAEAEVAAKTDPTVLIVDDSITVRELLSMSFNKVGYRVEQARDGQEAWDKLRSGLPCDLVFCDIEMPRMDGLELLSRMQKDNHLKHVPIAMLTSRGADRHRQMAVDLGASGYFTKPYLEEALLDAAQRMLNGETLAKGRGG